MINVFLFSSPCFSAFYAVFQLREVYQALCCNKLSTVSPSPSHRQNKSWETEAGSETCHLQVLFETKTGRWRDLLGHQGWKKKKKGLFLFSFWKLYWLDCVWRLQACAGVAREQVEAQERRKVCESCLYTKLHESQQHKGETRSVVEDWISAYYSFKTSWDSRLTFIRAIANVDFLHFYTSRG